MKYSFRYLDHQITVYGLDVCRWLYAVDENPVLIYRDGEEFKVECQSKNAAVIAACRLVRSMVEDEV